MCPFLSTLKMTLRRCVFLVWQEGKAARLSRLCALRACARTSNRARSTLYFGAPCHAVSPSPRALSPSASLARFDRICRRLLLPSNVCRGRHGPCGRRSLAQDSSSTY